MLLKSFDVSESRNPQTLNLNPRPQVSSSFGEDHLLNTLPQNGTRQLQSSHHQLLAHPDEAECAAMTNNNNRTPIDPPKSLSRNRIHSKLLSDLSSTSSTTSIAVLLFTLSFVTLVIIAISPSQPLLSVSFSGWEELAWIVEVSEEEFGAVMTTVPHAQSSVADPQSYALHHFYFVWNYYNTNGSVPKQLRQLNQKCRIEVFADTTTITSAGSDVLDNSSSSDTNPFPPYVGHGTWREYFTDECKVITAYLFGSLEEGSLLLVSRNHNNATSLSINSNSNSLPNTTVAVNNKSSNTSSIPTSVLRSAQSILASPIEDPAVNSTLAHTFVILSCVALSVAAGVLFAFGGPFALLCGENATRRAGHSSTAQKYGSHGEVVQTDITSPQSRKTVIDEEGKRGGFVSRSGRTFRNWRSRRSNEVRQLPSSLSVGSLPRATKSLSAPQNNFRKPTVSLVPIEGVPTIVITQPTCEEDSVHETIEERTPPYDAQPRDEDLPKDEDAQKIKRCVKFDPNLSVIEVEARDHEEKASSSTPSQKEIGKVRWHGKNYVSISSNRYSCTGTFKSVLPFVLSVIMYAATVSLLLLYTNDIRAIKSGAISRAETRFKDMTSALENSRNNITNNNMSTTTTTTSDPLYPPFPRTLLLISGEMSHGAVLLYTALVLCVLCATIGLFRIIVAVIVCRHLRYEDLERIDGKRGFPQQLSPSTITSSSNFKNEENSTSAIETGTNAATTSSTTQSKVMPNEVLAGKRRGERKATGHSTRNPVVVSSALTALRSLTATKRATSNKGIASSPVDSPQIGSSPALSTDETNKKEPSNRINTQLPPGNATLAAPDDLNDSHSHGCVTQKKAFVDEAEYSSSGGGSANSPFGYGVKEEDARNEVQASLLETQRLPCITKTEETERRQESTPPFAGPRAIELALATLMNDDEGNRKNRKSAPNNVFPVLGGPSSADPFGSSMCTTNQEEGNSEIDSHLDTQMLPNAPSRLSLSANNHPPPSSPFCAADSCYSAPTTERRGSVQSGGGAHTTATTNSQSHCDPLQLAPSSQPPPLHYYDICSSFSQSSTTNQSPLRHRTITPALTAESSVRPATRELAAIGPLVPNSSVVPLLSVQLVGKLADASFR